MKVLEAGLVTLWAATSGVTNVVGTRICRDPAPEQESHPLLVFSIKRDKVGTCDSGDSKDNGYWRARVTFKGVDEGEDQSNADAVFEAARDALMAQTLTVAGYTVMGIEGDGNDAFSYQHREKGRLYQHVGGECVVLLQKS